MTSVVACAHNWTRDAQHGASTNVTLTCQVCGAASVSTGTVRSRTVTAGLDIYPPRGAQILAPDLYDFFLRQWDAQCRALTDAGYTVNRRPPTIHTSGRPTTSAPKPGGEDRTRYGVGLAVGIAVTLVGGIAMLVAGLSYHWQWLAVAGGATLGVLALLLLFVVVLSS